MQVVTEENRMSIDWVSRLKDLAELRNNQWICKICKEEDPMVRQGHDAESIFNIMHFHWITEHAFELAIVEPFWAEKG
jgi:hypothetical protein